MNKTPSEVPPSEPLSKAEREARKAFRQVEAKQAMSDHDVAQKAFVTNHARLRAERLAREAAAPPVTKTGVKRRTKAKKSPLSKPPAGWSS